MLKLLVMVAGLLLGSNLFATVDGDTTTKILVIDSYHQAYIWSQETQRGFAVALQERGLLSSQEVISYRDKDSITNSHLSLRRIWLNTKINKTKTDLINALNYSIKSIKKFDPDIILLGDDNATRLVGTEYIDTGYPIVFWGVNGSPLKYGLLDTLRYPGHNITGVYQSMYHKQTLELLTSIFPQVQTIGVLADDSKTSRAHMALLRSLNDSGQLNVKIKTTVVTDSFTEWQQKSLAVQNDVDAFFILNHSTLRDEKGVVKPSAAVAKWHVENIKKPEASGLDIYVNEGLLCNVEDSGFQQGYNAGKIALEVLFDGKDISTIAAFSPPPGKRIVNRKRLTDLGVVKIDSGLVDKWVER